MTDKTREDFEEFVSSELGDVAIADEDRYISPKIQNYWLTWQAATARAMAEAVRVCESVNNHDNPMTARDCADAIKEALK